MNKLIDVVSRSAWVVFALLLLFVCEASAGDWPMFRGPGGSSVGEAADLPVEWSVEEGKNIAWQSDLPGHGVSGPIVVGDKVFVTASSGPDRGRLHVIAFDVRSGEELWHRKFWATGKTLCYKTSAVAAPTPASDGERVFAFFSSNDLIALDLDGNLQWIRGLELDYPGAGNALGMASSPVVAGDVVVVQSEAQGNSFVAALDQRTGATRWDLERPKASNWCSPIAVSGEHTADGKALVALQSGEGIGLFGAEDGGARGQIEMECEGIPSLTFDASRRLVFAPANGITVLEVSPGGLGGEGGIFWRESKLKATSSSPVVVGDEVFVVNRAGVLTSGSITEKKVGWKLRMGGTYWATPVVSGKRIYCVNADGKCFVVELGASGEKGKIVGENEFGEEVYGSPAIADKGLFVRSHKHLWKIAK